MAIYTDLLSLSPFLTRALLCTRYVISVHWEGLVLDLRSMNFLKTWFCAACIFLAEKKKNELHALNFIWLALPSECFSRTKLYQWYKKVKVIGRQSVGSLAYNWQNETTLIKHVINVSSHRCDDVPPEVLTFAYARLTGYSESSQRNARIPRELLTAPSTSCFLFQAHLTI